MRVAVLGGGIQGVSVAFELASRGVRVDLYDRESACLTSTSANNEGEIHLGYVYARDRSLRTARLMVKGAGCFENSLRRWVGKELDRIPVSEPFTYLVHSDGLSDPAEFEAHLRACHRLAVEAAERRPIAYFGRDPCKPPTRVKAEAPEACSFSKNVDAAFATEEIGVDSEVLCDVLREQLDACGDITQITAATVTRISRRDGEILVEFARGEGRYAEAYDHVVNALWDGRLAIDALLAIEPQAPWSYRMRYFLRVSGATPLPSVTIVLGPFGDIANYKRAAHLTWYPAGRRHWSFDLAPPRWPRVLSPAESDTLAREIVDGLATVIPSANLLPVATNSDVKGGVIFAIGTTDVDDPGSSLHCRDLIGVTSVENYHSINTGKLTMAPYFAHLVCDRIAAG